MTDHDSEKTRLEQALTRWDVSEAEYINRQRNGLFLVVVRLVCKSPNISKSPNSEITIFSRGNKYGFAIAIWSNMGLGECWPPVVQATAFESQEAATMAGIDMFIRMAKSDLLKSPRLENWAKGLLLSANKPQQMSLF